MYYLPCVLKDISGCVELFANEVSTSGVNSFLVVLTNNVTAESEGEESKRESELLPSCDVVGAKRHGSNLGGNAPSDTDLVLVNFLCCLAVF